MYPNLNRLILVGGIFYGWPGYIFVLKEEGVFQELCNQTELIATNQTSCVEQDAKFNSIFVTACLLANFFSTLCGIVMDKFGLLCARVFTSTQMTLGLIMMIFYSNRTALEYGAYLIAMSSIGNLLTNITVQVSSSGKNLIDESEGGHTLEYAGVKILVQLPEFL